MNNFNLPPDFPQDNIEVNTVFFPLTGSPCAGMLLNQLYYYKQEGQDGDGWIPETSLNHQVFFLTEKEYKKGWNQLKKLGLLEKKRIDSVLHYRVNTKKLDILMDQLIENYARGIKPKKTQAIERRIQPTGETSGWEKALEIAASERIKAWNLSDETEGNPDIS